MAEKRKKDKKENLQNQRTRNAQNGSGRSRPKSSGSFKNDPDKPDQYFQSDPKNARRAGAAS